MNEATLEVKRGPGRPPKEEMKKGTGTWQPANVLDVFDKEPGYRYRVVEKSPRNVAKKQREGWEIVSGIQSPGTGNNTGNYLEKGKQLTSVVEGYDYVVMRLPEEMAQQRDSFYNDKTARSLSAIRRETNKDLGKEGALVHGTISLEKRGVRNIIKD